MIINKISLAAYSALRVGGEGDLVVVTTVDELKEAHVYAKTKGLRVHILGQGTNTYFGNNLSQYVFIKPELFGIELQTINLPAQAGDQSSCAGGRPTITAAAGENWDDVVKYAVDEGLWGIENLSCIPGTVGAAPVQNIGAYGTELKDVFVSLDAYDIEQGVACTLASEACEFGYRDSIFKRHPGRYCILSVTLKLSTIVQPILSYAPLDTLRTIPHVSLQQVRDLVITTRQAKLPDWKEYANVGSFFKNPVVTLNQGEALRATYPTIPLHDANGGYKVPAAWLIEHVAEMKGVTVGNLRTWDKQPLVIVNDGTATADEVDRFADIITSRIVQKTNIILEQEVNRIG